MKKLTTILWIISILLWGVLFALRLNTQPEITPQDRIAELAKERYAYTELKQQCLDDLPYYESFSVHLGKSGLCSERDEKIAAVKKEHGTLLDRPYKQVWGLTMSR